jgi:hypothetical protein
VGSYDNYVYCVGDKRETPKPPETEPKPDPNPQPQPPQTKNTKLQFWMGSKKYTIDGQEKQMDTTPIIYQARAFMPARYMVEGIGGTVDWDASTKMITCKTDKHTLKMWIGKTSAELDGVEVKIGNNDYDAPRIERGRVLVPFRFLGESLGCVVTWVPSERRINVEY